MYEGEDWEDIRAYRPDKRLIQFADKFYPWDRPECLKLRKAGIESDEDDEGDDFMEEWRKEIAMEAGMGGGLQAYRDHMYDYDIDF